MKRKLLLLGLFVTMVSACSEAPVPVEKAIPVISATTINESRLEVNREFIGRTAATSRVELRARISGVLEERLFEEGMPVAAEDPLYIIESDSYQASVAQAKALVASDHAQLNEATMTQKRVEKLVLSQSISDQDADSARTATRVASAALDASRAALQRAELDLQYTSIIAPSSGVIGETNVNVGNLVGPDSGVLATIVALDPIYVHFTVSDVEYLNFRRNVSMSDATSAKTELRPHLRLSNGEAYAHAGDLELIGNEIDSGTGTLTLRASFPNPKKLLRPGQFVSVVFKGETGKSGLLVPQKAVLASGTGRSVLVVDGNGKIEQRAIEIGEARGENFVVKSGLVNGERVVTRGLQKVRPGMSVNVALSN
jgi:membrane fusion protein (multidrug efflux system)